MNFISLTFKAFILFICAVLVTFLSGCATTGKMVLTPETPTLNISSDNSVVLLVIETSKDDAGGWSRIPIVEKISIGEINTKEFMLYEVPIDVVSCKDYKVKHLISILLQSKKHRIQGINGHGLVCAEVGNKIFRNPFGNFNFDLKLNITPIPGKVVYAGHIKANMRERKSENETRAGSIVPLLEQKITGFYSSTFDITVEDMFDEDVAMFHDKFPALNKMEIIKSIAVRQNP